MSEAPAMNEKLRARMQTGAESLLEPGESVRYGVLNLGLPALPYLLFAGLLLLPYVIQKSSMVIATERNVYVLKTGITPKARRILLKAPLGSVAAHTGGNAVVGRYLVVGDQKAWLLYSKRIHEVARAIAEAASGVTAGGNGAAAPAITAPDASGPAPGSGTDPLT